MKYKRMPIEVESPEEQGYETMDCNLSESSMPDQTLGDILVTLSSDLVLQYTEHRGHTALRKLIALQEGVDVSDVLLTTGAAGALFIVHTCLLTEPGSHLVVIRPNYATNLETPRAIGCEISYVDLRIEEKFHLDVDRIASAINSSSTSSRTKLISVTSPHNPTGVCVPDADIRRLVSLSSSANAYLLIDATYGDMRLDGPPLTPHRLGQNPNVITVSSFSKTYGLPGLRLGWIVCRDKALYETMLAAKEQMGISGSVIDEEIGFQIMKRRSSLLPSIQNQVRHRRDIVCNFLRSIPELEWVTPEGGLVCFPRVRSTAQVNIPLFYNILRTKYRTMIGPGHWFERGDEHFRLGFGYQRTDEELIKGLENVKRALREASTA